MVKTLTWGRNLYFHIGLNLLTPAKTRTKVLTNSEIVSPFFTWTFMNPPTHDEI